MPSTDFLHGECCSPSLWLSCCNYQVFTWGAGSLGQLGHGVFVKSGLRNSYEELAPRLLEAFEGKAIQHLEFGATHSAASMWERCNFSTQRSIKKLKFTLVP